MKTACVYHRIDLDGWMSAAIVKQWWTKDKSYRDPRFGLSETMYVNEENHSIEFIGYHYGDPIPDLSVYDKIVMVDISFPNEIMLELTNKLSFDFIWIDHHQPKIEEFKDYYLVNTGNILDASIDGKLTEKDGPKFAACELTWQYFFPDIDMPEIVRLLGRYDCFGHRGTDEEEMILTYQYGFRARIKNYKEAYDALLSTIGIPSILNNVLREGVQIYRYLCVEAKSIYDKGFEIKLNERVTGFPNSIEFKTRKFICFNRERFNPINFGINYHFDGYDGAACFWYQDGKWQFSLYNDNGEVDVSLIAKQFNGGGHKGASGFIVNDLKEILR